MKKFRVGDISITQVVEWEGVFPTPESLLNGYEEAAFARHLSWLSPDYYDTASRELRLVVQCWLLKVGGRTILFDTGSGNDKNRPNIPVFHMLNLPFLDVLEKAGAKPGDIDTVVCSHLHIDHVGWNTHLDAGQWRPTFPNAKYIFPKVDFDFWNPANAHKVGAQVGGQVNDGVFEDSVEPVAKEGLVQFVDGIEEIGDGLRLEPAPGHTPGQMRLRVESKGEKAVLTGDVIHHPIQVYEPTWNSQFCEHPDVARTTRHELLSLCADENVLLLPAHFAGLNAVHIAREGEGFRIVEL
jgi:glyoxylase-like metal-dependent hydrolase (beta-lactamase superfamily II)